MVGENNNSRKVERICSASFFTDEKNKEYFQSKVANKEGDKRREEEFIGALNEAKKRLGVKKEAQHIIVEDSREKNLEENDLYLDLADAKDVRGREAVEIISHTSEFNELLMKERNENAAMQELLNNFEKGKKTRDMLSGKQNQGINRQ